MSLLGSLWGNKVGNLCVSASGGDETGTFYSGSQVWRYHKFETTGSHTFTIHSGSAIDARVLLVGGGAGGGVSQTGPGGSPVGAGGGGGGGVLFSQYRLHAREYDIVVGDGGTAGNPGEDTTMTPLYPTNDTEGDYFPTSSVLTIEGGGEGGYSQNTPDAFNRYTFNAKGGGSGGGASRGLTIRQPGSQYVYESSQKGGGRTGQGSDGGIIYIPDGGSTTFEAGAGGGGAAETGSQADFVTSARTAARGGHGLSLMVDGTNRYYGAGGGGRGEAGWPTSVANGSNSFGAGGSGSHDGSGGNPGDTGYPEYHDKRAGRAGIAVVMYPICEKELTENCTQYQVDGGALGGDITWVNCTTASLASGSLGGAEKGLICSYDTTAGTTYPLTTGDVTLTETGSCDSIIPLVTGSICELPFEETEMFQTQIVCDTPPVAVYPGYITVEWTDYQGNRQTDEFTTGTHYVCGQPGTVAIVNYTVGATWNFYSTDILCAYYCRIPVDESGSLEARGGDITGSYVRGDIVYKFHTFRNSGTLEMIQGHTSDFDILVVGGGGAGGGKSPSISRNQPGGGGGGGGFITSENNAVSASDGNMYITVGDSGNNSSINGNFLTASVVGYKGGRGGDGTNNGGNGASGGGAGGAHNAFTYSGSAIYGGSPYNNSGNDGGSALYTDPRVTNYAAGGGGAGTTGSDGFLYGPSGIGGEGLQNDFQGFNTWFSGGGSGGRQSSKSNGGGGAQNEAGLIYTGGGGGGSTSTTRYPGGKGLVVVRYALNEQIDNNIINSLPVSRSLFSLIDMAFTASYPTSGSTLYDVSNNYNTASIGNVGAYEYNTAVLDSGSLILLTSSLDNTDFDWDLPNSQYRPIDGFNSFTLLVSWFGNFMEFNSSSGYLPIFSDNSNDWGIYGGNAADWDEGIVLNAGGQLIEVGQDTAKESGGGIGWHISHMSYDSGSSTVYWNCDGVSGSAVVSGSSFGSSFNPKWNDKFVSGKLGDNSACQVFAIYTGSLTFEEMESNRAFLYDRY